MLTVIFLLYNVVKRLVSWRDETQDPSEVMEVVKYNGDVEESPRIKFSPSVCIQRYTAVQKILSEEAGIEKVVDFGCASGQFIKFLKRIPTLREIIGVDIMYSCLAEAQRFIRPLPYECLMRRDLEMKLKLLLGNVADQDSRLRGFDAVTCIELIEHLEINVLDKLPENIFGYIKPKIIVMTTPNKDFNVVFSDMQGKRHWDHKFEWTREEFQAWCSQIINQYPEYDVSYSGVGDAPEGFPGVGWCSQIAVFRRKADAEEFNCSFAEDRNQEIYELIAEDFIPGLDTPVQQIIVGEGEANPEEYYSEEEYVGAGLEQYLDSYVDGYAGGYIDNQYTEDPSAYMWG